MGSGITAAGITAAAGMAALAAGTGSGVATAGDSLVGKSFSDASRTIAGWGGTAVVSTVVGDRRNRDDCTVETSWRKDAQDHRRYLL